MENNNKKITARRRSYIWFYYELRIGTPRIYSYHTLLLGIHPKKYLISRILKFRLRGAASLTPNKVTARFLGFKVESHVIWDAPALVTTSCSGTTCKIFVYWETATFNNCVTWD